MDGNVWARLMCLRGRDELQAAVNAVINLKISCNTLNFLLDEELLASPKGFVSI